MLTHQQRPSILFDIAGYNVEGNIEFLCKIPKICKTKSCLFISRVAFHAEYITGDVPCLDNKEKETRLTKLTPYPPSPIDCCIISFIIHVLLSCRYRIKWSFGCSSKH